MPRSTRTLFSAVTIFLVAFILDGFGTAQAQSSESLDLTRKNLREIIKAIGLITSKPIPSWGVISGAKDGGLNLSEGEIVFIKMEPDRTAKPGDRFIIVRKGKIVEHPVTKKPIGNLIIVPGDLVIVEGTQNMVKARIAKSYAAIYQGDLILPSPPVLPETIPIRSLQKIEGMIIECPEGEENITEREFVIIDRGSNDGVIVGTRFNIYQQANFSQQYTEKEKGSLPMVNVGEAVAVSIQEENCTALITRSSQAVYVGDKVVTE